MKLSSEWSNMLFKVLVFMCLTFAIFDVLVAFVREYNVVRTWLLPPVVLCVFVGIKYDSLEGFAVVMCNNTESCSVNGLLCQRIRVHFHLSL